MGGKLLMHRLLDLDHAFNNLAFGVTPASYAQRSGIPYPGEKPVTVIRLGVVQGCDNGAVVTNRLGTTYYISSTDRHLVQAKYSECYNHPTVQPSPRNASVNDLVAEIVHYSDDYLKTFIKRESPAWGPWLKRTVAADEHGSSGMLVMVDKILSLEKSESALRDCNRITVKFDFPRIQNLDGISRCVWVESVEISQGLDKDLFFSDLRICLRDDRIGNDENISRTRYREALARGFADYEHAKIRNRPVDPAESTAMESLRECLTEDQWRKYLKRGFILVRGSSGREYQIFKGRWHTKVRENGQVVAEVCSRVSKNVPPTDHVIAFKTMIEADEGLFEKAGNVYKMTNVA